MINVYFLVYSAEQTNERNNVSHHRTTFTFKLPYSHPQYSLILLYDKINNPGIFVLFRFTNLIKFVSLKVSLKRTQVRRQIFH